TRPRPHLNTMYYISVKSITVGTTLAAIDPHATFDIREDGSGGFIIDSASTVTYLAPAAFRAVADVVDLTLNWNEANGSDFGFSLCYQMPPGETPASFPDTMFYLEGGAEYVVEGKYNFAVVDEKTSLVCMLMLEMDEASVANGAPSILGNMQQQNYHILYDNGNQMLSFTPASCRDISEPAFDQSFLFTPSSSPPSPDSPGYAARTAMSLNLIGSLFPHFNELAMVAPGSVFKTWSVVSNHRDHCSWIGVQCDSVGRVVGLSIFGMNISGPIPPQIKSLSVLRLLNFSNNMFNGSLPTNVLKLRSVESLDMYDNNFEEPLPVEVSQMVKLKYLHLGGNYFSGSNPPEYARLKNSEYLSLTGNDLTGRIPEELGLLENLKFLSLGYYNNFTGGIPP
ncbi:hypothetical protein KI387_004151, partial [Taxus chinensis]